MCGICGVAGHDPRGEPLTSERLLAMTTAMTHRGPDEHGHLRLPGVALGMRRLSIIDLAGSHQPISNEDGTVRTVFNGEIFNFQELRYELEHKGHRFSTAGDTETIVHLYEEYGEAFVERLRGMFAIALWDANERVLVLARDRLGVKPLYYTVTPDGLSFASEVKCLLAGGLVSPELDSEAARLYLTLGYVPAPRTLFAGILKLPPANVLEWRGGRLMGINPYWTPLDPPAFRSGSWEEDQEHLLELLRNAVRARMISDVPLGVMLSGGLDSSLIAALMAEASPHPIETFSVGFVEDANANELAWARITARRLGANHHELLTSASEHEELLDDAIWHLEEPIADLSFLGFLALSQLAREHVTVALCGQAADELLGGYPKHMAARAADVAAAVPATVRGSLAQLSFRVSNRAQITRLLRTLAAEDDLERLLAMSSVLPPGVGENLGGPNLKRGDPRALLAETFAGRSQPQTPRSRLIRTLLLDLRLALPDLMFLYFDKMSMATSLEVRVPFADHELVNFCMALSPDRRIRGLRGKEILRRVSRGLVDEAIIERPKRGFFRAGASSWLSARRSFVAETLLDGRCGRRGLLNVDLLRRWLDEPLKEGRGGEPLLAAFLLERWHRVFADADGLASQQVELARQAAVRGTVNQPVVSS
ncbi:MAG: asparagine synthase (glutamine-hydrolyzing) [Solirubrobacterales bacterium]|nr:asparagine synthase (glutamine-hydrolyzing) [Solirubrobacterales bacterium]